jgi:hypothetical protein
MRLVPNDFCGLAGVAAAEAIWSHVLVASASAESLVVQDSQTVRAPG